MINNSDHQAVLRLSNLVEGMYKFRLTVADGKGLKGNDDVTLTVKEGRWCNSPFPKCLFPRVKTSTCAN